MLTTKGGGVVRRIIDACLFPLCRRADGECVPCACTHIPSLTLLYPSPSPFIHHSRHAFFSEHTGVLRAFFGSCGIGSEPMECSALKAFFFSFFALIEGHVCYEVELARSRVGCCGTHMSVMIAGYIISFALRAWCAE
jgi:hypothetical protein